MLADHMAGEMTELMMHHFLYFVREREWVRTEKAAGAPAPWTEDKILQEYRFCNIRRRDDRVSHWLIRNWYAPHSDHPLLWMMPVVARWINWPPMLTELTELFQAEELGDRWFENLGHRIDAKVAAGGKAWTGAYMITARTVPDGRGKGDWIANSTLKPIWVNRAKFQRFFSKPARARTVEEAMSLFNGQFNHGTFMAGQIVADWTYTHLLNEAPDLYKYAPIGPGSTRGLNRLFGRGLEKRIPQEQFNAELEHALHRINEMNIGGIPLTLHDVQNCFCEFDKYVRLENGGRVRAKYQPETRY